MTKYQLGYLLCIIALISCGRSIKTKPQVIGLGNQLSGTDSNSTLPLPTSLPSDQVKYGIEGKVLLSGAATPLSGANLSLTLKCNNSSFSTASATNGHFSLEFFTNLSCDNQSATACLSFTGYQNSCLDITIKKGILVNMGNLELSPVVSTPVPTVVPVTRDWTVSLTVSDAYTGMSIAGAKVNNIIFVKESKDHVLANPLSNHLTDQNGFFSALIKGISSETDVVRVCISKDGYEVPACIEKTYSAGVSYNNFSFVLAPLFQVSNPVYPNPTPIPIPSPVVPAPSISFLVNGAKSATIEFNTTAKLKWETKGVSNCMLSSLGNVEPSGEKNTQNLASNTSITLSCKGYFGEKIEEAVQITVKPDPGRWYQATSVDCVSTCVSIGKTNAPSSDGARCVSGERRVFSSVPIVTLTYGCWGMGCYGETYLATFSVGKYCYTAGQKYDNDRTDLTVGCFCK